MVRIRKLNTGTPTTRATKTSPKSGAFSVSEARLDQNDETGGAGSVDQAGLMSALIGLQSRKDSNSRTHGAAQRILSALDALQLKVLENEPTAHDIGLLKEMAATTAEPDADPSLVELFNHISLRAQVEIAKLESRFIKRR